MVHLHYLLEKWLTLESDLYVQGLTEMHKDVQKGEVYLALPGLKHDGRQHVVEAIEHGAVAVIYDPLPNDFMHSVAWENTLLFCKKKQIEVISLPDLSQKRAEIAARFYQYPSKKIACFAVTGTNGKTTCAHWMAQLLGKQGMSCGVIGTLGAGSLEGLRPTGNTTPGAVTIQRSLASFVQSNKQCAVLEASSHALVQGRLDEVAIEAALFTQLAPEHLDYHHSMQAYAAAKKKLFSDFPLKAAVINKEDAVGKGWAKEFMHHYSVITYGLYDKSADIFLKKIEPHGQGFYVKIASPWGTVEAELPALGIFNLANCLGVLGVLGVQGFDFKKACADLQNLSSVPGRAQVISVPEKPQVIIDYAHTPEALQQILSAVRTHYSGKIWCVFGCGGERDANNRAPMGSVADKYSDVAVITSDNSRSESPSAIAFDIAEGFSEQKPWIELDRAKAIVEVLECAETEDIVVIAGKGHERYQYIGARSIPHSDIGIVQEIFSINAE